MRIACLLASVALLAGCSKGATILPYPEKVAAVQLAGYTNVVMLRPSFTCDPYSEEPRVFLAGESSYLQQGLFFTAKFNGHPVKGAICSGKGRPTRIGIMPPVNP